MRHAIPRSWLGLTVAAIIPLWTISLPAADTAGPTAEQAWQRLKDGNQRFAADRPEHKDLNSVRRKALTAGQHPFAIVLACADSRVPPEIIFDQGLGNLFVVRVAGNISEPFALGSIDYAVEHLHVPLVVVLGHEKCGAVTAALAADKPTGNLGRLIGDIHVGRHHAANKDQALAESVGHQAKRLADNSDVIREHVKQKKLRIVAGVNGLASGKVQWLDAE